jgi:hypothetical protein
MLPRDIKCDKMKWLNEYGEKKIIKQLRQNGKI